MTPRRIRFEWTHKLLGYLALVLALIAIVTGLVHADAPRWMFLALAVWWTGLRHGPCGCSGKEGTSIPTKPFGARTRAIRARSESPPDSVSEDTGSRNGTPPFTAQHGEDHPSDEREIDISATAHELVSKLDFTASA